MGYSSEYFSNVFLLLIIINGAAGSCTLRLSTFLQFLSAFAKRATVHTAEQELSFLGLLPPHPRPPYFCGPKELKSFNINSIFISFLNS